MIYCGNFITGVKDGLGQATFSNGDVYKGKFMADNYHGYGIYRWNDGVEYRGNFSEGRFDGLGEVISKGNKLQKLFTLKCFWKNGVIENPELCRFDQYEHQHDIS